MHFRFGTLDALIDIKPTPNWWTCTFIHASEPWDDEGQNLR